MTLPKESREVKNMKNRGQMTNTQHLLVGLVIIALIGSWTAAYMVSGVPGNTATEKQVGDLSSEVSDLKTRVSDLRDRVKSLEQGQTTILEKIGVEVARISTTSISVPPAKPGEEITVTVSVMNAGGKAGSKDITLEVDGEELRTKPVSVDPGETKTVQFDVTLEEGTHTVSADGQLTSVSVKPTEKKTITLRVITGTYAGAPHYGYLGPKGEETKKQIPKWYRQLKRQIHPTSENETIKPVRQLKDKSENGKG
ncbi:hypothetical protein AKJ65_07255 [candidate division MSBL1 archaeon SCGC-AAA259E19]|uniref:CARDB domain-containing protein n=1 Tax=candidate division MSBL1 archaeon SCGC-AAA259E19 TaxID=1698264 RepID=A0A133UEJ3_9EURY|nr:hypothetical protein AKJ65_07255 [candidate division MSBL1 archaeon SCGC-AAA259E19]